MRLSGGLAKYIYEQTNRVVQRTTYGWIQQLHRLDRAGGGLITNTVIQLRGNGTALSLQSG